MDDRTIVVGVDGSPGSRQALLWAVRQASTTESTVRAISAWHLPQAYSYGSLDYWEMARESLARTVEDTLTPAQMALVSTDVIAGQPGPVLVDASRGAQLLVVGRHNNSDLAATLLGSVSRHCTAHALCPVVVVRAEDD